MSVEERQFTAQEIQDAVDSSLERLKTFAALNRKTKRVNSTDSFVENHNYYEGATNILRIALALSVHKGFGPRLLKDEDADKRGLKPDSPLGDITLTIEMMCKCTPNGASPEALLAMEVFAEALGIKQQYIAARGAN